MSLRNEPGRSVSDDGSNRCYLDVKWVRFGKLG
jgi:hypothetical protein